jgi:anti-sigma B factor antagonist
MEMSLERYVVNDAVMRLAVVGEVDVATCGALSDAIHEAIVADRIAELIVDLDKVTFLDSSGVRALLTGLKLAQTQGAGFSILNARGVVRGVLDITGVLAALTAQAASQDGQSPHH